MKRVYCYFDALGGSQHQGELIRLWYLSWTRRGWAPRMLSPRTFHQHPDRKRFKAALEARGIHMRTAPFYRWLALSAVGGGLLVDYDLINFGFSARKYLSRPRSREILLSPGFFHVGRQAANYYVKQFIAGVVDLPDYSNPLGWASVNYGTEGWQKQPLVHFSTRACLWRPKHEVIESCGRAVG